ncbi:hypothetical protein B7494_g253 [Chlorociboria aeruginascens]|nr:hypothetical protein B7494_g253 [Chlorociboria aeruginascens]
MASAECIDDSGPQSRMRHPIDGTLVALRSLVDRCQSTVKKMRRQSEEFLSERDHRHNPGVVYDHNYSSVKEDRFKLKRDSLLKRSKSLSAGFRVTNSSSNATINDSITVPTAPKARSVKRLFSRKHDESGSTDAQLPKAYSMRSIFSSKKRDEGPGENITKSKRERLARFFGRKTEISDISDVSDVSEEAEVEEVEEEVEEEDGEEEDDQEISFTIEDMDDETDEANEEVGSSVSDEAVSVNGSWYSESNDEEEFAFDLLDYHIQELEEEGIPFAAAHRVDHSPPGTPTSEYHNLVPEEQPEDNQEEFMKPQYWLKRKGDHATIAFDTPAGFEQDCNLSEYYKMPLFEPVPRLPSRRMQWTDVVSFTSTDSSTSSDDDDGDDENITYKVDKLLPPAQCMILYLRGKGWGTQRIADILATLDDDFLYKHDARWYRRHKFPDHTSFDDEMVKRICEIAPRPRMPWDYEFDPQGKRYPEAFRFLKSRIKVTIAQRFVKKVLENYFYYCFTKTVYHMILNWPA